MQKVNEFANRLISNVEKVIVGKRSTVELTAVCLLCQGHLLIEDVPGVGKTMLARGLARSIGGSFKRLQFTPDMLPADVTGPSVYNQKTGDFEFRPSPVFTQILLADEINRATPKTQAALLEAMEEKQVTVDGITRPLSRPFLVLATQNPIEYEGTFPLPEAQLDRFLMRLALGYPSGPELMKILDAQQFQHPISTLTQTTTAEELLAMQEELKAVHIDNLIKEYIVAIVERTRGHQDIYLGASPRGALALYRTSQARAALAGRDYVIPDDVKALVGPTLSHRVIISPSARIKNVNADSILEDIVKATPVPGTKVTR
ncbi:MAG: MoxR family ATPase [Anaerolineae bacterium]|nr:MoxR family ATPase [Anaerolineae bacterium]